MSKNKRQVKYSQIELLTTELHDNIRARKFTGNELTTASSLLSYYVAGVELSFKQVELIKILNAKCKVVRPEKEKTRKRSLYAISNGEHVKLGISTNIGRRIKDMQTSNANDLELLWRYYVGKDKKLAFQSERKLHRLCKKHKIKGEWFSMDCMDLVRSFKVR